MGRVDTTVYPYLVEIFSWFSKSERMLTQNLPCKERTKLLYGMTYMYRSERAT